MKKLVDVHYEIQHTGLNGWITYATRDDREGACKLRDTLQSWSPRMGVRVVRVTFEEC